MANAWHTIKRLVKSGLGSSALIVEGDEATHVVLTVEEYERLTSSTLPAQRPNAEYEAPRHPTIEDEANPGSIRIEDLPL